MKVGAGKPSKEQQKLHDAIRQSVTPTVLEKPKEKQPNMIYLKIIIEAIKDNLIIIGVGIQE